ncbi:S26 family signal peptidase [Streptomyces sp. NBC_01618]|uniref:S26 family signal peptidase n=1 Tax=Streptomyces sp. NBC_01618 TaxID=2975900 RepID=UPI003869AB3D|nr:S26 family signal peptidase [Streptomyces sp. NBC_01618]
MLLTWGAIGLGTCAAATLVWLRLRVIRIRISGVSMLPTFRPGDRVLARRVPESRIVTGDIVVLASPARSLEQIKMEGRPYEPVAWEPHTPLSPGGRDSWVIKRVAAMPGEPVPPSVLGRVTGAVVPQGSFIALGDNAADSIDSRHHGYLPLDGVLGRVVRRRQPRPTGPTD